jgi:hypothetical protein
MENLIDMVGDTVGQLTTQRAIFKYAPAIFKGKYGAIDKGDELLKAKEFERLSKYKSDELENKWNIFMENEDVNKAEHKLLNKREQMLADNIKLIATQQLALNGDKITYFDYVKEEQLKIGKQ